MKNLLTESFKNTILGWIGVRSNNTQIEDLIDAYCKDPKHAERKNRPLLKKIMAEFLKDKRIREYKEELLKKSVNDHNVEASYNVLIAEITMAMKKMISSERYRKAKSRYEIAVRLIANALLAMLAPRLKDNARTAYRKYAEALAKAKAEDEARRDKAFRDEMKHKETTSYGSGSGTEKWSDPAYRDDEYAVGHLGDGKYRRH